MDSIQSKLTVGTIVSYLAIFKGKFYFIDIIVSDQIQTHRIQINI